MKYCNKCSTNKDLSEYGLLKSGKQGRRAQCRECRSAYRKTPNGRAAKMKWVQSEKGKAYTKAYAKEWRESPIGKAKVKAYKAAYVPSPESIAKAKVSMQKLMQSPERIEWRESVPKAIGLGTVL